MIHAANSATAQNIQQLWETATANQANQVQESAPGFGEMLGKMVENVDTIQKTADAKLEGLVTGQTRSIQDVVLKMEEADIAFNLMKEVRDKLVHAYKEILSMQS